MVLISVHDEAVRNSNNICGGGVIAGERMRQRRLWTSREQFEKRPGPGRKIVERLISSACSRNGRRREGRLVVFSRSNSA